MVLALEDPPALRELHENAARHGLEAQTSDGTAFRDLARQLLAFSQATIGGENCKWSEPEDLAEVARRIG